MAGGCLILCLLIQVLLITPGYGSSTKITLNCPNISGTEGKPLNLTCNVTCEDCTLQTYILSPITNITFNCSNEPRCESASGKCYTIKYTIKNASREHNVTVAVFVQTTAGYNQTEFKLSIEADKSTHSPVEGNATNTNDHSHTVIVVITVISCLIIIIIVGFFLKRGINNMMGGHESRIII